MSVPTIKATRDHFGGIVRQEESSRATAAGALQDAVAKDLQQKGVSAAASVLKPRDAAALKGFAKIFQSIDSPIAALMEELLARIGITAQVFQAAQIFLTSDSIGLDPHERLGIPAWKYGIIEEINDLMDELDRLERTVGLSQRIDRKNEIEEQIKNRMREINTGL